MGAVYNKATTVLVTSEVESLGQMSLLHQLLLGLPVALHMQGDLCSVPRKGCRAPGSRPV